MLDRPTRGSCVYPTRRPVELVIWYVTRPAAPEGTSKPTAPPDAVVNATSWLIPDMDELLTTDELITPPPTVPVALVRACWTVTSGGLTWIVVRPLFHGPPALIR